MEILLIRHALPVRLVGDGPVDPPLAPMGRRQAAALAGWLEAEPPDALVASPMARARETADAVAQRFALPMPLDEGLAELDRGSQSYIPLEEIRGTDSAHWKQLVEDWVGESGAERRAVFQATVIEAVERSVEVVGGERLAIVCHGGVINAYLSHVLGLQQMMFFEPAYTSISRVRIGSGGRRQLVSVNEASHLRVVDPEPA